MEIPQRDDPETASGTGLAGYQRCVGRSWGPGPGFQVSYFCWKYLEITARFEDQHHFEVRTSKTR